MFSLYFVGVYQLSRKYPSYILIHSLLQVLFTSTYKHIVDHDYDHDDDYNKDYTVQFSGDRSLSRKYHLYLLMHKYFTHYTHGGLQKPNQISHIKIILTIVYVKHNNISSRLTLL